MSPLFICLAGPLPVSDGVHHPLLSVRRRVQAISRLSISLSFSLSVFLPPSICLSLTLLQNTSLSSIANQWTTQLSNHKHIHTRLLQLQFAMFLTSQYIIIGAIVLLVGMKVRYHGTKLRPRRRRFVLILE